MTEKAMKNVNRRGIEIAIDSFRFHPVTRHSFDDEAIFLGPVAGISRLQTAGGEPVRDEKEGQRNRRRGKIRQKRSDLIAPETKEKRRNAKECCGKFVGTRPTGRETAG